MLRVREIDELARNNETLWLNFNRAIFLDCSSKKRTKREYFLIEDGTV